jgi:hypothetical protein
MLTNRQPSASINLIASLTLICSSEYAKVAPNIHHFWVRIVHANHEMLERRVTLERWQLRMRADADCAGGAADKAELSFGISE